jgi:hypothetical protein
MSSHPCDSLERGSDFGTILSSFRSSKCLSLLIAVISVTNPSNASFNKVNPYIASTLPKNLIYFCYWNKESEIERV